LHHAQAIPYLKNHYLSALLKNKHNLHTMSIITQTNLGMLHEKISVTIQTTDYLPAYEKALKEYAKKAALPGFRKGMIPPATIKKMYGTSILSDEILKKAGAEIEKYVIAQKLKFYGRPLPVDRGAPFKVDVLNPTDYTFDFEIGLQKDFDIPVLNGSKSLEALKVIVTENMIDEEVEKVRYRAGKMSDIDAIAHEDDVINVTFLANGANTEGKQTNSLLVKYFSPDAQAKLMGKVVNDTIEIILGSAFDEKLLPAILKDLDLEPTDESAKGLYYNMTIDKIGHVEKAVLDAGLFDDIYKGAGIVDEADFRQRLKTEIQGYWDGQGRNKLHNEMYEILVHETEIDIPTQYMKRWVSEGGETLKPMAEVEAEWSKYEHSMRWELICGKIANENNINVSRDEIEQGIRNSVMQYFSQMGMMADMNTDADWMQGVVDKQMKDKAATNEIYNQVMTEKLFGFIETKMNINFKEVALEEFMSAQPAHHHHH
jgi:trigger factor